MAARSARSRFNLIVALSLGGQLLAALAVGLAFADVRGAAQREAALNQQRVALSALGEAALALYTHEAHTYIEGGPGHLDHLAASEARLEEAVAAVVGLPLPAEAVTELSGAIQALGAERAHFSEGVAPAARAGALDRAQATAAHAVTESLAAQAARRIGAAMVALDGEAARARAEAQHATRRALVISAMAVAWGGLLAWGLARGLSVGLIGPLDELGQVARRLGYGERDARAVEAGDQEVAALARGFNHMADRLRADEEARVRAERLGALGELSAAVAHELLNPLTVILGDPRLKEPELRDVREEAEHARRVVVGLLGFARPGEEPATTVRLGELAERCVERLGPTADARDLRLAVTGEDREALIASPSAARQVLDNLVRNAIEASPAGAEVVLELVPGLGVRVHDRGPGLPEAVRRRLYEPFVTGRPDGTGLGLAVCQRVVRSLGGALRHDDRPGGGTTATWVVKEPHA
jgi:signal transduction histidine kinase